MCGIKFEGSKVNVQHHSDTKQGKTTVQDLSSWQVVGQNRSIRQIPQLRIAIYNRVVTTSNCSKAIPAAVAAEQNIRKIKRIVLYNNSSSNKWLRRKRYTTVVFIFNLLARSQHCYTNHYSLLSFSGILYNNATSQQILS